MSERWLQREREESASDRILDAAGELFASQGVVRTNMGDVARAAGCSRATLYRYFENRDALRIAFVHRVARRVQREVIDEVGHLTDPGDYVVEAILAALRRVRTDPQLAAWWQPSAMSIASELTGRSAVIESLASAFVGDINDPAVRSVAMWLVRVVVAFVVIPDESEEVERETLQRFVAPAIRSLASPMAT